MRRAARLRLLLPLALVAAAAALPAPLQAATTITVSGYVFRDLDNDGVRDPGEPGVPGVRVHRSTGQQTPTATTAQDGSYVITGLTPQSSGYLIVESGWFRSQCAALTCASGPGPDNDYATDNQFIRYPLAQLQVSTSNLDVGVLPDWPGATATAPAPVGGAVPANLVDVASRLSWVSSSCPGGRYLVCRAGDTYTARGQILNQGRTALTGLTAVLDLPAGDRIATGDPARDVTLLTPATSPTITGITVGAVDAATQSITIDVQGSLPPGGYIKISANAKVVGGPGTSGCVVAAPSSSCPTQEPQGAPLTFAVTHVDQAGDPDSFGPDCPPGEPVTSCPTGIHDKQFEPDEVDPVGHNVDAALGTDSTYDLVGHLVVLKPAGGSAVAPGAPVVLRAWGASTGPATALPGWKLTLVLPQGSKPAAPAKHALRNCVTGTNAAGYRTVTCTGKGPLSPGVASFAIDVALVAPSTSGAQLTAIAIVTPAAGQGTETVAAGPLPTQPSVNAAATATNNDASVAVPIT